jgi:hypothetical protein
MRALVVVESVFGNTRRIAEAISSCLSTQIDVRMVDVAEAPTELAGIDLVVVGGPTHAFGMTRLSTRRGRRGADRRQGCGRRDRPAGMAGRASRRDRQCGCFRHARRMAPHTRGVARRCAASQAEGIPPRQPPGDVPGDGHGGPTLRRRARPRAGLGSSPCRPARRTAAGAPDVNVASATRRLWRPAW